MSEIKLLPCPFCGEEDLIYRNQMHFTDSTPENMIHEDGTMKWSYIECGRCGCSTKAYCYEYQSTNKWNTRKPMERIDNQILEYFQGILNKKPDGWDVVDFSHDVREIIRNGGKE